MIVPNQFPSCFTHLFDKKNSSEVCLGFPPVASWHRSWSQPETTGLFFFGQGKWSDQWLHPRNLTQPLKIGNPKRKLIFQASFFRGYVKFRGCSKWLMTWLVPLKSNGWNLKIPIEKEIHLPKPPFLSSRFPSQCVTQLSMENRKGEKSPTYWPVPLILGADGTSQSNAAGHPQVNHFSARWPGQWKSCLVKIERIFSHEDRLWENPFETEKFGKKQKKTKTTTTDLFCWLRLNWLCMITIVDWQIRRIQTRTWPTMTMPTEKGSIGASTPFSRPR